MASGEAIERLDQVIWPPLRRKPNLIPNKFVINFGTCARIFYSRAGRF